ncbi:UNVERIFIED_CONTAM: hypothetical protein K2H54_019227 [Gekko kuhli]
MLAKRANKKNSNPYSITMRRKVSKASGHVLDSVANRASVWLKELPRRDGQEMSASSLVDLSASAPNATLKRPTSLSRHASAAGFPLSPVVPRGIGKAPKPLITHSPGESYEETVLEAEDIAHLLADVAHFAEGLEKLRDVMLQEGE